MSRSRLLVMLRVTEAELHLPQSLKRALLRLNLRWASTLASAVLLVPRWPLLLRSAMHF